MTTEYVFISKESLEIVNKFCQLGDMCAGGCVEESFVFLIRCGLKKFRELACTFFQSVFRNVSGVLFSMVVRSGNERRRLGIAGEK